MAAITQEAVNRYLACRGQICPVCESEDTQAATPLEKDDNTVKQAIQCATCGSAWTDVYQLSTVINVVACPPHITDVHNDKEASNG